MKPYGCHNRAERPEMIEVQDGWFTGMGFAGQPTRLPRMVLIPAVMSRDCKHTTYHPTDPRCAGCREQQLTPAKIE